MHLISLLNFETLILQAFDVQNQRTWDTSFYKKELILVKDVMPFLLNH